MSLGRLAPIARAYQRPAAPWAQPDLKQPVAILRVVRSLRLGYPLDGNAAPDPAQVSKNAAKAMIADFGGGRSGVRLVALFLVHGRSRHFLSRSGDTVKHLEGKSRKWHLSAAFTMSPCCVNKFRFGMDSFASPRNSGKRNRSFFLTHVRLCWEAVELVQTTQRRKMSNSVRDVVKRSRGGMSCMLARSPKASSPRTGSTRRPGAIPEREATW